jgi:CRP-like cAMP-binding protein
MKDEFDIFRAFLSGYITCSDVDWKLIRSHLGTPRTFEKGELLCKEGHSCDYLWYQVTGIVRFWNVDADGVERTRHFSFPDIFFTSYDSFIRRIPSLESIQALESTIVIPFHYKDNESLTQIVPLWKTFAEQYIREVYTYFEQRLDEQLSLTAEQRYHAFFSTFPEYAPRIPLQYVASYLGVTPQSLSRIRRPKYQ